ncbi:hypothetical protein C6P46_005746 [Rhodotorula mucilaginosa]|uniref:Uncharacterized protein n=1 Tax=Rhodotorula mucilaginosa TaxID=5537 RepID=A0A9P6W032_RHOMI|nr:hypothetical protein C6P46_005746 [Rhodotorula mucilaginosa]
MSAVYSIFTSPHHPPVPDHLPTLIVTPNGRPNQVLYTYLHTAHNTENYLLTPSDAGDLCVAKLYPPDSSGSLRAASTSANGAASSLGHGSALGAAMGGSHIRCEASRGLNWRIHQTGIQNPVYKLLLPNPDQPQSDQPLFQISKPNPNAPYWSMFYFAYAGHLIPPKRVEFGRISKNPAEAGGGTRVAITGRTDEEKAVWKSIGDGNEDGVEWIVLCAALAVLDDEIVAAAEKAGFPPGGPSGPRLRPPPPIGGGGAKGPMPPPSPTRTRIHPPVNYSTELPRSASSHSLGQADGRLPAHAPPRSPQRQRVAPPQQQPLPSSGPPPNFAPPAPKFAQQQQQRPHTPPQGRPIPSPHQQASRGPPPQQLQVNGGMPPGQYGGGPPPQPRHQNHNGGPMPSPSRSAPPPAALQPAHPPPPRQHSAPMPSGQVNGHVMTAPPPRQASLASPASSSSRQPANYHPSGPGPAQPHGIPRPGPGPAPVASAPSRGFQLSDGPSPSSVAAPPPPRGADSSAAARMVQREVEAKRLQKMRNA